VARLSFQEETMVNVRRTLGSLGEEVAACHLREAGLVILDRNWRCEEGELDIVARDAETLVFCEVKTRSGDKLLSPAEAVVPSKRRRIRRLALKWIAATGVHAAQLRFDVVGVRLEASGVTQVMHVREAF
jgi:putative endonuclease